MSPSQQPALPLLDSDTSRFSQDQASRPSPLFSSKRMPQGSKFVISNSLYLLPALVCAV